MENYEAQLRKLVGAKPLFVPWVWAVVQDQEGRLLVAIKEVGLGLPGWPMEIGEQFQDTVARDLQTFLGLAPEDYRLEKQFATTTQRHIRTSYGEVQTLYIGYLITVTGQIPRNKQGDFTCLYGEKLRQELLSFDQSLPFLQQYLQALPKD